MTLSQPRTLLHRWLCVLLAGVLAWGLPAASAENVFSRELKLGDQGEDVRLTEVDDIQRREHGTEHQQGNPCLASHGPHAIPRRSGARA